MTERYSRQIRFRYIGEEGQRKLLTAKAAVIGMGALGCSSSMLLARAGVGYLRIIDRDLVELSNLQRQILYTEADAEANLPKVHAAASHLKEVNSSITVEPCFKDLNAANCEELLRDMDLIVDATDNMETRYLINEYCVEHQIPWIYGGAVGSEGMTAVFLPQGPCFSCFTGHTAADSASSGHTCSTEGVLNSLTSIVASFQATEAIKLLTGSSEVRRDLLFLDIWANDIERLPLDQDPDCPVCVHRRYEHLGRSARTAAISLCGRDAWQIIPPASRRPDLKQLAERLRASGQVTVTPYFLQFRSPEVSFRLFTDGRAIIEHVSSEGRARSVYSEYIGL